MATCCEATYLYIFYQNFRPGHHCKLDTLNHKLTSQPRLAPVDLIYNYISVACLYMTRNAWTDVAIHTGEPTPPPTSPPTSPPPEVGKHTKHSMFPSIHIYMLPVFVENNEMRSDFNCHAFQFSTYIWPPIQDHALQLGTQTAAWEGCAMELTVRQETQHLVHVMQFVLNLEPVVKT